MSFERVQIGDATLYLGDCREVAPTLGLAWADVIIADPPYGETALGWDKRVDRWVAAVGPTLKRSGSMWVFGSLKSFIATRDDFTFWKLAQEIVWEKHNGSSFHADRFKRVHELAAQFWAIDVPWAEVYKSPVFTLDATKRTLRRKIRPPHMGNIGASDYTSEDGGPRLMRSVLQVRSCHGSAVHPTQKPTGILTPLIEYSCPPGGVAFDPTMGSGSSGVAAIESGRKFVGCETEREHFDNACKRITEAQRHLFAEKTK